MSKSKGWVLPVLVGLILAYILPSNEDYKAHGYQCPVCGRMTWLKETRPSNDNYCEGSPAVPHRRTKMEFKDTRPIRKD